MKKSKKDFISGNLNSLILRYLLWLFPKSCGDIIFPNFV